MFLNYIKELLIKKILTKKLESNTIDFSVKTIKSVGLIIDESRFFQKSKLIDAVIANGILKDNIRVIVYNDKLKSNGVFLYPTFGLKHINWKGEIKENVVKNFIQEQFDILISYYDIEKPALMLITQQSNSYFKIGFATIDKRLNNFIIDTNAEKHQIFTFEMFKYLKILNKI